RSRNTSTPRSSARARPTPASRRCTTSSAAEEGASEPAAHHHAAGTDAEARPPGLRGLAGLRLGLLGLLGLLAIGIARALAGAEEDRDAERGERGTRDRRGVRDGVRVPELGAVAVAVDVGALAAIAHLEGLVGDVEDEE